MITITKKIKKACPTLALGLIRATVVVGGRNKDLWREIDKQTETNRRNFRLDQLPHVRQIQAVRGCYQHLGKKPSKYRGSAEALMRRILKNKGLYQVNNVVDVNNLVSLRTMHPVGSYDLSHLQLPLEFGVGSKGQSYKGIGKEEVNIADLPVFLDREGPYGSPTSDSERAMIRTETTQILMVILAFSGTDDLQDGIDGAVRLLTQYAQATDIQTEIVRG